MGIREVVERMAKYLWLHRISFFRVNLVKSDIRRRTEWPNLRKESLRDIASGFRLVYKVGRVLG